tara:strand:+ start:776 stop:1585 length:810 start_codon:yes stop_codon:yes gene_type:complete
MPILKSDSVYRFDDVNECIYCGSKEQLTDEHIVPFALGGNFILPKSSCKSCAAITSLDERKVLKGFMLNGRIITNMPTRRKKERPKHLKTMLLDEFDNVTEIDLPTSEGVAVIHLPIIKPPSILTGAAFTANVEYKGVDTIHVGKHPAQVALSHGKKGVRFEDKVDINAYFRMIAKISHSFHVANLGLFPRSESPLLPIILGKAEGVNNWIGSGGVPPKIASDDCGQILWCTYDKVKNIHYTCLKMFASNPGGTYISATRVPGWALYSK